MYIVTTSKRIHQITALVFVCLALIAGFAIYRHYQGYTAQPNALTDHLLRVVNQSDKLKMANVDMPQIEEEARRLIYGQLLDDLGAAGMPNIELSAATLIEQATSFLNEDKALLNWLTLELQKRTMPTELLHINKIDLGRRELISNGECLVIEKNKRGWQLVSLFSCQSVNDL